MKDRPVLGHHEPPCLCLPVCPRPVVPQETLCLRFRPAVFKELGRIVPFIVCLESLDPEDYLTQPTHFAAGN